MDMLFDPVTAASGLGRIAVCTGIAVTAGSGARAGVAVAAGAAGIAGCESITVIACLGSIAGSAVIAAAGFRIDIAHRFIFLSCCLLYCNICTSLESVKHAWRWDGLSGNNRNRFTRI